MTDKELERAVNTCGKNFLAFHIEDIAERYEELSKEEEKYPVFNETGEITELEDVIVVRFG